MKASFIVSCLLVCVSMTAQAEVLNYKKVTELAKEVLGENNFSLTNDKIKDIDTFCPQYKKFKTDDKENFFAHLVAQMSIYESSFNTNTTFLENNGNISAGLLGISYGSISGAYKTRGCDVITSAEDLKDAKKNLKCGFAIMSRWTEQHNNLALDNKTGASIYWSTLRTPYQVEITVQVKTKVINEDGAEVEVKIPTKKTVTVGKKLLIIDGIKKEFPKCYKK